MIGDGCCYSTGHISLYFAWVVDDAKCILVSVYCPVCLSLTAFPHYCTDPDVTWETVGAPHLCTIGRKICNQCTGFVAKTTCSNAKCQQLLVLHVCLVSIKDPSSLACTVSDTLPLSSIVTSNMQFFAMASVSSLVLTRDMSSMASYLALCLWPGGLPSTPFQEKGPNIFLPPTLPNADRLSKFFHRQA